MERFDAPRAGLRSPASERTMRRRSRATRAVVEGKVTYLSVPERQSTEDDIPRGSILKHSDLESPVSEPDTRTITRAAASRLASARLRLTRSPLPRGAAVRPTATRFANAHLPSRALSGTASFVLVIFFLLLSTSIILLNSAEPAAPEWTDRPYWGDESP